MTHSHDWSAYSRRGIAGRCKTILREHAHVGGADRSAVGPILCKLVFQTSTPAEGRIEIGGLTIDLRSLIPAAMGIDNESDQVSKGHLVDALALRGDEGRATLR